MDGFVRRFSLDDLLYWRLPGYTEEINEEIDIG
jgi:hypothetical protein